MKYALGTKMYWKSTGLPAFEKTGHKDWDYWHSLEYDLDKPLDKRYGFRWTDSQVFDYYNSIMDFK